MSVGGRPVSGGWFRVADERVVADVEVSRMLGLGADPWTGPPSDLADALSADTGQRAQLLAALEAQEPIDAICRVGAAVTARRFSVRTTRVDGGVLGSVVDVSHLYRDHLMLQAILEGLPGTFGAVDTDLRYTALNGPVRRQLRELYGRDYEVGDRVIDGMSDEMATLSEAVWRRALQGDSWMLESEFGDVARLVYESHFYPLRDEDGQVFGAAGWGHEVSERVRAQRALARSNELLREFASILSHDLREPIRGAGIYLQLLQRELATGQATPRSEEHLSAAFDQLEQADQLIHDLLAWARTSHLEKVGPVALDDVAAEVLDRLRGIIEKRDAKVSIGPLPVVKGSFVPLVELLANLVANAVRYNDGPDVQVEVSGATRGDYVELVVHDNGIGIDPSHHGRIFSMFTRLHPRGSAYGPGSGAGLAIVARVAEMLGGSVSVESQPGAGATFRVTLPAASGPAVPPG